MLELLCAALIAGVLPQGEPNPRVRFEFEELGAMVVEFDRKEAPRTTEGILQLVEEGFYDRQKVHRVEPWVIQWGDPQTVSNDVDFPAVGQVGSDRPLPFERSRVPFIRGTLGMASKAAGRGGDSQIFILRNDRRDLEKGYVAFGRLIEGYDLLDKIERGARIVKATRISD